MRLTGPARPAAGPEAAAPALAAAAVGRRALGQPLLPRLFRVVRRRRETADTVTLVLEPVDGEPMPFAGGQFTMLGPLDGGGEAPISISGDPDAPHLLVHTIRDVGGVTHALAGAEAGALLTARGPYGTGWDVADADGDDVLVVAGGIGLAPLRPVVLEVLRDRPRYRRVLLRYGARSPAELLFPRDLAAWRGRLDMDVQVTVDSAPADWRGRVGLVTRLLTAGDIDPDRCLALVCGPEVMMRFVATALVDLGVPEERIRLSMERSMSCGVGLCGHCQLRELFVCLDGPVFGYQRLAPLLSVQEL